MASVPMQTPGVTRQQIVLIGALGLIMAAVLAYQFGLFGGTDLAEETPAASKPQPAPVAAAVASATKPSPAPAPALPSWPKVSGEAAAAYDPFALPDWLARKIAETQRLKEEQQSQPDAGQQASMAAVTALKDRGASALLRGENGFAAAVVGNRVVKVGDEIEGFRVVAIDPDGLLLEPSGRKDSREERK